MFRKDPHRLEVERPSALGRTYRFARVVIVVLGLGLSAVLALRSKATPQSWTLTAARVGAGASVIGLLLLQWKEHTADRAQRQAERLTQAQILTKQLRRWTPARGVPLVREVRNPLELGVKSSAIGVAPQEPMVSPYVRRTVDDQLESELTGGSFFILIVGDSAAGKSRSAFEAIQRCFPCRRLLLPSEDISLGPLLELSPKLNDSILWLDNIEPYLPDKLTPGILDRLLAAGGSSFTVVATMRAAAHDRYTAREDGEAGNDVLERARIVRIPRKLDASERARVHDRFADARLDAALDRYGLGEYLAAGPELISRYENASATNPLGRALVHAAVDWRRAGQSRPIRENLLRRLCPIYLEGDGAHVKFSDAEFEQSLRWAEQRVYATSALLVREGEGFVAFDYLIDYLEQESHEPIPKAVLRVIEINVDPHEAYRAAIATRHAYHLAGDDTYLSFAQNALRVAAANENPAIANAARTTLVQLPADVQYFIGRSEPLTRIVRLLDQVEPTRPIVVVLTGKPGVGKTALAIRAAHQVRGRFPDGLYYVNLRGAEAQPLHPREALADILYALGVDRLSVPENLEDRVDLYQSSLSGRRGLVVLDNAATEDQVEPLLPRYPSSRALVTSRSRQIRLRNVHRLSLDVLEPHVAVELLRHLTAPVGRIDDDVAHDIVRLCGFLPLAIRIAGAKLTALREWTPEGFRNGLFDEHGRLDELQMGDRGVRASFALSYQSRTPLEQHAFRLLGLLEAPDFPTWTIATLVGIPPTDAELLAEHLVDAQLLEPSGRDSVDQLRYRFHDLIRVFARERLREEVSPPDQQAALKQVLRAYAALAEEADFRLGPAGPPYDLDRSLKPKPSSGPLGLDFVTADPLGWFSAERTSLVMAVEQGHAQGMWRVTVELASSLRRFLILHAHWADWRRVQELALAAARRLGDHRGEADALRSLSDLLTEQGQFDDAANYLKQCIVIFRELGDKRGEGDAFRGLAIAYRDQGRLEDAIECFDQCRAIFTDLDDRRGNAYVELSLGLLLRERRDTAEAQACFERSLEVFDELADVRGEAYGKVCLGDLYLTCDRAEEALDLFKDCLPIFQDFDERRWTARTLRSIGVALAILGNTAAATRAWRKALAIFADLGVPEAAQVAEWLQRPGG
jgi:tetratricopeptide (TPR) repeat protein